MGFDAHRLGDGRPLVLGGVEMPFPRGLIGHSDGDVLAHAVADALLGAAGEGDIGRHFPDSDERYRGVSGLVILSEVAGILRGHALSVEWVDTVVIAEEPKVAPVAGEMKERMAGAIGMSAGAINIKATTTEGMGFTGRGEGIAATAVACLVASGGRPAG